MDEPMERDSLGTVARLPTSSLSVTSPPALNAKLLGSEFEAVADVEIVNRALIRLIAVYGDPWGRDRSTAKVMQQEWEAALSDLPAIVVDEAVTEWVRSGTKWPRPADIRSLADRLLRAPIEAAAKRHGLHPQRIEPAEAMKGFLFSESPLRDDPRWRAWLDARHPTIEHCFFRRAQFSQPHEIFGLTEFEADYLNSKHGHSLTEHFGRPVGLGVGPRPCRQVIWTEGKFADPSPEARERVAEAVANFTGRMRGDTAAAKSPRTRAVNLAGASPEFLELIGERAEGGGE